VEMYSFPSPTTGEGIKGWGFKKKFHSIPSPLGRGLGRGFTLVELIVVVTILAILWTISFIALQWYSQEARDSKRISDVRSLISKITIESTKWTSYGEIINELWTSYKENKLKINWEENKEWYQNIKNPINREILKENVENFRDPTNNHLYPFAYAVWNSNGQWYNFIQLAYVEEKTGATKLVWNYYEMQPWDSPSLFTNTGSTNGTNIPDDYIIENWAPIYDIWVPYIPPKDCDANSDFNWYNLLFTIHWQNTWERTKKVTIENKIETYKRTYICNDWFFEWWIDDLVWVECVDWYIWEYCDIISYVWAAKWIATNIVTTNLWCTWNDIIIRFWDGSWLIMAWCNSKIWTPNLINTSIGEYFYNYNNAPTACFSPRRLPTKPDFEKIISSLWWNNWSFPKWEPYNMPASGDYRDWANRGYRYQGIEWFYRTSSINLGNNDDARRLDFTSNGVGFSMANRVQNPSPIRCVKDN
jgi:prepilin-type N-terminal cleavage/methylation domain-containing protein